MIIAISIHVYMYIVYIYIYIYHWLAVIAMCGIAADADAKPCAN